MQRSFIFEPRVTFLFHWFLDSWGLLHEIYVAAEIYSSEGSSAITTVRLSISVSRTRSCKIMASDNGIWYLKQYFKARNFHILSLLLLITATSKKLLIWMFLQLMAKLETSLWYILYKIIQNTKNIFPALSGRHLWFMSNHLKKTANADFLNIH